MLLSALKVGSASFSHPAKTCFIFQQKTYFGIEEYWVESELARNCIQVAEAAFGAICHLNKFYIPQVNPKSNPQFATSTRIKK